MTQTTVPTFAWAADSSLMRDVQGHPDTQDAAVRLLVQTLATVLAARTPQKRHGACPRGALPGAMLDPNDPAQRLFDKPAGLDREVLMTLFDRLDGLAAYFDREARSRVEPGEVVSPCRGAVSCSPCRRAMDLLMVTVGAGAVPHQRSTVPGCGCSSRGKAHLAEAFAAVRHAKGVACTCTSKGSTPRHRPAGPCFRCSACSPSSSGP